MVYRKGKNTEIHKTAAGFIIFLLKHNNRVLHSKKKYCEGDKTQTATYVPSNSVVIVF